jgi:hypothetical protein
MLSPEDEHRAVTEVVQRLTASFPHVPPDVVQYTVRASYEKFAGSPIRDFVPVLVERMARTSLVSKSNGT